jgi:hypothetical protein
MESPFNIIEHTVPCSHIREYARATATIDAPMHLCVKQYIPLDNINAKRGDATLIATHGSGMPKARATNITVVVSTKEIFSFNTIGAVRATF